MIHMKRNGSQANADDETMKSFLFQIDINSAMKFHYEMTGIQFYRHLSIIGGRLIAAETLRLGRKNNLGFNGTDHQVNM